MSTRYVFGKDRRRRWWWSSVQDPWWSGRCSARSWRRSAFWRTSRTRMGMSTKSMGGTGITTGLAVPSVVAFCAEDLVQDLVVPLV